MEYYSTPVVFTNSLRCGYKQTLTLIVLCIMNMVNRWMNSPLCFTVSITMRTMIDHVYGLDMTGVVAISHHVLLM